MHDSGRVTSNFLWRFFERCGAQGVTFIVSVILARHLDPEVYGTVALVSVFSSIMSVFVTSGLNDALIRKKDADDLDFSTVFYFNIFMCLALYALAFFLAPLAARYYERLELTALIRALSLILICAGVKNIQCAYVSRHLLFKKFFFSTLVGTVVAAVVGIWMAYHGYGAWALIVQNLVNTTIDTIILWITVKWRPKKMFSFARLKELFGFAWKLLMSSLIDTVYSRLYALVIGKKYTDEDLAFYTKGDTFPNLLVTNINAATDSVLLPVLAEEQDDRSRVREMTRRAIKLSSYVIMPMMAGLGVCAVPVIRLLLKEKWLPCVPYLRIFCFTYAFYCVHTANLNAIKAVGRSDLFLKLEILKKLVGISMLLITVRFGVIYMACGSIVTCILSQLINAWPNRKLLDYSYGDQLKDMLPNILLCVLMGIPVYCIQLLGLPDILTLCIQVPLGVGLYILFSRLLRVDSFDYVWLLVKKILHRA